MLIEIQSDWIGVDCRAMGLSHGKGKPDMQIQIRGCSDV